MNEQLISEEKIHIETATVGTVEQGLHPGSAGIPPTPKEQDPNLSSFLRTLEQQHKDFILTALSELWRHRIPFLVLLAIIFVPSLLPSWIALIAGWSLVEFICNKLPEDRQAKLKGLLPNIHKAGWFKELGIGISQVRPFLLFAIYIFCAPIAIFWMLVHWVRSLKTKEGEEDQAAEEPDGNRVLLVQNKQAVRTEQESNFFHSPVFGLTIMLVFFSGAPALVSYFSYFYLGVDTLLGSPSQDPQFNKIFLVIGLYIASIGWCLSLLFLRAWFTFPTNFLGEERLVELNEDEIKRHPQKNWFSTVLTLNCPWEGAELIEWKDAVKLSFNPGTGLRFYPLPEHPFSADSTEYKILNKIAAVADGVVDRIGRVEYIQIQSKDGSNIRLNLWELNSNDRARIFYAVRKWAPHVVTDLLLQEKLLGSKVLAAPRYTQIWFDLLSSGQSRQRVSTLKPGDTLKSGLITVKQRIGTGGQATVYIAEQSDGSKCVLKEFVLSSADTVGALIESAADFDNEAGLLSRLSHPGIVKLIDVFTEDRRVYLELEEVPGKSLRQIVQTDGALPEDQVRDIALQVCEILKYLHSQEPPLVHRDLSPDNLVLTFDGQVKLIDFSLATAAASRATPGNTSEATSTITRSGCVGKFGYTPPEQFREQVFPQSDIYAFGGTLFYLLTGKDPKPLTQSSVASLLPDTSAIMDLVIRRATELDMTARYDDVSWIKLDLGAREQETMNSP